jgi:hypothetical protein
MVGNHHDNSTRLLCYDLLRECGKIIMWGRTPGYLRKNRRFTALFVPCNVRAEEHDMDFPLLRLQCRGISSYSPAIVASGSSCQDLNATNYAYCPRVLNWLMGNTPRWAAMRLSELI